MIPILAALLPMPPSWILITWCLSRKLMNQQATLGILTGTVDFTESSSAERAINGFFRKMFQHHQPDENQEN